MNATQRAEWNVTLARTDLTVLTKKLARAHQRRGYLTGEEQQELQAVKDHLAAQIAYREAQTEEVSSDGA